MNLPWVDAPWVDAPWVEHTAPWVEHTAPWVEHTAPWVEHTAPWVDHTAQLVRYVAHFFNQVPSPLTEASISKLLASVLPRVRCYVHCALHMQELFLRHWHDFAVHLVPTHQEAVLVWLHACARARPQHAQLTLDLERACGGAAVVRAHYCAPQWQSMARRLQDRVRCRARFRVLQQAAAEKQAAAQQAAAQQAAAQQAAAAKQAAEQQAAAKHAAERAASVAKIAATAAKMAAYEANYNATAARLLRQKASQAAATAAYRATLSATRSAERALQCAHDAREARNSASARASAAAQASASRAQEVAQRACGVCKTLVQQLAAQKAVDEARFAKQMALRKSFVAGRLAASVAQGAANSASIAARRAASFATIASTATHAAIRLKDEGGEKPTVKVRLRFKGTLGGDTKDNNGGGGGGGGGDTKDDGDEHDRRRQHLWQRDQNTWRRWRRHVLNQSRKSIYVHPLLLLRDLLCRHALTRVPAHPRGKKKMQQTSWSYPRYQLVHHVPSTSADVNDCFDVSTPMPPSDAHAKCRDNTHLWLATLHISDAQISTRICFVLHFGWKLICQFLPFFAATHVQQSMAAARWKTKPHRLRRPFAHYELRSLTAPLIAQSIWTPTNRVLYIEQLNRKIEYAANVACEQALGSSTCSRPDRPSFCCSKTKKRVCK